MNNQTQINWSQAQQVSQQVEQEKTQEQEKALKDFLDSNHELTDARDLEFYIGATGEDLNFLLDNASGINPQLKQALWTGATLDDLYYTDFTPPEDDEDANTEPADVILLNGDINIYFLKNHWNNRYVIHVGDWDGRGYCYPNEEHTYNTLKECKRISNDKLIKFARVNNLITQTVKI